MSSFWNQANDSSARKFLTSDSVQNNPVADASSNVDHVIDLAAGLKSIAVSVKSIAARALAAAADTNQAISSTTGSSDPLVRARAHEYSDSDVTDRQEALTRSVSRDFSAVSNRQIRDRLENGTRTLVNSSLSQFASIRDGSSSSIINRCIPEIESVLTETGIHRGASDIFFTRLTFNLPADSSDQVRAIRIFRSVVTDPIYTRPLATLSSHGIERLTSMMSSGVSDPTTAFQKRLSENGIPNAIDNLNPIDPYTNLRVAVNGTGLLDISPKLAGQVTTKNVDPNVPDELKHLDLSVTQNVNVLANLRQNPLFSSGMSSVTGSSAVGQSDQRSSNGSLVVDQSNFLEFQELAFLSLDQLGGRRIGDRVEYIFDDETVSYGLGYRYFIVTIDSGMNQSSRSAIVNVVIEGLRVPPRPSDVTPVIDRNSIVLTTLVEDSLIEKFEIYRKEDDPNRLKTTDTVTISDPIGFTVSRQTRELMDSGFLLIGESLNPIRGGSTWSDERVQPGRRYTYRVYSVDIFGNKSESPFEVDVYVPDLVQKYLDLRKPTILAEVDATTLKIRITFNCEDEHVETLRLERRDLTLGQESFSTPDQPSRIVMGMYHPLRRNSLSGERIFNQEAGVTWSGVFQNTQRQQVFIDYTTTFDHVYQYRIMGEDRYGNRTSYDISRPVLTVRRPFINAPLNLSSSLQYAPGQGDVAAVVLTWSDSNLDKSAEDLIGDQAALSASQVRTLYQVERKKVGEEIWQRFSLMTGTTLIDPTVSASGTVAPNYRPPYLEINTDYLYRVQAVQTGAFISNFTDPLTVFVGLSVTDPVNFSLRVPPVYTRPFYVMLNWDVSTSSGVIDHWEIERADVNNFAASRLNVKNPSDFKNVVYSPHRKVYRESSRFIAKVYDESRGTNNQDIIQGKNYYMDSAVDFGNTYFYRIRAVSPQGQKSGWVYRGIKITSAVFEGKWSTLLTESEKRDLSNSYSPLIMRNVNRDISSNTFGLQSDYSKPTSLKQP